MEIDWKLVKEAGQTSQPGEFTLAHLKEYHRQVERAKKPTEECDCEGRKKLMALGMLFRDFSENHQGLWWSYNGAGRFWLKQCPICEKWLP